eukprot:scaffold287_cov173-Amphora_coffeaeformis.AAC.10
MTDSDLLWSGRLSETVVSRVVIGTKKDIARSLLRLFPSLHNAATGRVYWKALERKFTMAQQVPLVFAEAINVSRATAIFGCRSTGLRSFLRATQRPVEFSRRTTLPGDDLRVAAVVIAWSPARVHDVGSCHGYGSAICHFTP